MGDEMAKSLEKQLEEAKAELAALRAKRDQLPELRAVAGRDGNGQLFVRIGGELDALRDQAMAAEVKVLALQLQIEGERLQSYDAEIKAAYEEREIEEAKFKEANNGFQAADHKWRGLIWGKQQQESHIKALERQRDEINKLPRCLPRHLEERRSGWTLVGRCVHPNIASPQVRQVSKHRSR
jgi:hypothetical protein